MGIAGEDDDGEQAKTPTPKAKTPTPKAKPKAPEKLTDKRFDDALTALKENKITKATILAFDLTEKQKVELNK